MENQQLKTIFRKYLDKTASPEDIIQLLEYFNIENDREQLKELILLEIAQPLTDENIIDINEAKVFNRVEKELQNIIDKEHQKKSGWQLPFIRIAAAAVLLVMGSYALWTSFKPDMATVYVAYGKHQNVSMPDQSKIILDAGTTIAYQKGFKGSARTVELKNGEAFFDVKHDVHRPFVVKANGVDITVLGTSFDVSSYDKENETKISVTSGKVGIQLTEGDHHALFLLPGDQAIISRADATVRIVRKPIADIGVWRDQRFIFEDQPLADVMQRLERKYNVHIEIQNKQLLSETVTMRLNNQPLKDVMVGISYSNHFNYEIVNDQLIVIK